MPRKASKFEQTLTISACTGCPNPKSQQGITIEYVKPSGLTEVHAMHFHEWVKASPNLWLLTHPDKTIFHEWQSLWEVPSKSLIASETKPNLK